MHGSIIAVLRIEPKEAQPRPPRSHSRIEEYSWYMKFSLQLRFNSAYSEIRVEGLKIGHQNNSIGIIFEF
jgi:hypothetical protein